MAVELTIKNNTTIQDLQRFAANADGGKIRGTKDANGEITLYVSNKGSGTGLKELLFGSVSQRRQVAEEGISQILMQTPRADNKFGGASVLNAAFSHVTMGLPGQAVDLHGTTLAGLLDPATRAYAQANLPAGVNVDRDGVVSGTIALAAKQVPGQGPVPVDDAIDQSVQDRLDGKSPKKFKDVGGIVVHQEFLDDGLRMNFSVGGKKTNGGDVSSTEGRSTEESRIAKDLRAFAGSDNATKVLSALLHQGTLNNLVGTTVRGDGAAVKLHQPQKSSNPNPDRQYIDGDGARHSVGDVKQYSGAKIDVSKYNDGTGDFKISVDWDFYFSKLEGPEGGKVELVPDDEDRVIKMNTTFEMRVSKAEADKGTFDFSFPKRPTATFDGKLT